MAVFTRIDDEQGLAIQEIRGEPPTDEIPAFANPLEKELDVLCDLAEALACLRGGDAR